MRKILPFLLILVVSGACSGQTGDKIPAQNPSISPSVSYAFQTSPEVLGPALEIYLNGLGNIGVLENEVIGLFDAVSGSNFKGNAQLGKQLELILPKANTFLEKLQMLEMEYPEIRHFHDQYVDIWREQVSAFEGMKIAIDSEDQQMLQREASKVENARSRIQPLQDELEALTDYAGIQIVF